MVIVLIEWMYCDQRKYEEEQEDESVCVHRSSEITCSTNILFEYPQEE